MTKEELNELERFFTTPRKTQGLSRRIWIGLVELHLPRLLTAACRVLELEEKVAELESNLRVSREIQTAEKQILVAEVEKNAELTAENERLRTPCTAPHCDRCERNQHNEQIALESMKHSREYAERLEGRVAGLRAAMETIKRLPTQVGVSATDAANIAVEIATSALADQPAPELSRHQIIQELARSEMAEGLYDRDAAPCSRECCPRCGHDEHVGICAEELPEDCDGCHGSQGSHCQCNNQAEVNRG